MAHWLCLKGTPPFRLTEGKDVTIGRGRHCDLSLYSSLLSREHARVRWEGGRPVLFDLESLNGCFVGLDRIHRHELKVGDVIRLGDVQLHFQESGVTPKYEASASATPIYGSGLEKTPVDFEPGSETRFFSRTAALHQKVFDYDELFWLLELVERLDLTAPVRGLSSDGELASWRKGLSVPNDAWVLLRLGIIQPKSFRDELGGLSADDFINLCRVSKRGERLKTLLGGGKTHWNEMASLRYQVRQGRIFKPLRAAARAYRPGGGLASLGLPSLIDELQSIYAPDLSASALEGELRRLMCLGFLSATEGANADAWYPTGLAGWADGAIELARRGSAMMQGFRLEE